mmetsp:Transcript_53437/g.134279  ORF Transcript_53437/g.134279 Transcript_53437/m.134279 type:complete len:990 (-) Transcript_53437:70-3039(-)
MLSDVTCSETHLTQAELADLKLESPSSSCSAVPSVRVVLVDEEEWAVIDEDDITLSLAETETPRVWDDSAYELEDYLRPPAACREFMPPLGGGVFVEHSALPDYFPRCQQVEMRCPHSGLSMKLSVSLSGELITTMVKRFLVAMNRETADPADFTLRVGGRDEFIAVEARNIFTVETVYTLVSQGMPVMLVLCRRADCPPSLFPGRVFALPDRSRSAEGAPASPPTQLVLRVDWLHNFSLQPQEHMFFLFYLYYGSFELCSAVTDTIALDGDGAAVMQDGVFQAFPWKRSYSLAVAPGCLPLETKLVLVLVRQRPSKSSWWPGEPQREVWGCTRLFEPNGSIARRKAVSLCNVRACTRPFEDDVSDAGDANSVQDADFPYVELSFARGQAADAPLAGELLAAACAVERPLSAGACVCSLAHVDGALAHPCAQCASGCRGVGAARARDVARSVIDCCTGHTYSGPARRELWLKARLGDVHVLLRCACVQRALRDNPIEAVRLLEHHVPDTAMRSLAVHLLSRHLSDERNTSASRFLSLYFNQLLLACQWDHCLHSPLWLWLLGLSTTAFALWNHLVWITGASFPFDRHELVAHMPSADEEMNSRLRRARAKWAQERLSSLTEQPCKRSWHTRCKLMLWELEEHCRQTQWIQRLNSQRGLLNWLSGLSADCTPGLQHQLLDEFYPQGTTHTGTATADRLFPCTLPLECAHRAGGLDIQRCKVMSSNARPLWLHFVCSDGVSLPVIFKKGDDLRKDAMVMQLLKVVAFIWEKEGLPLCVRPYSVRCTGLSTGLIEVVQGSETLHSIEARYKCIRPWLRLHNPRAADYQCAVSRFTQSLAACCVIEWVVGIKDRHASNLMICPSGQFFHIDFGFILNEQPSFPLGFKREFLPFTFRSVFADLLNEEGKVEEFKILCERAYMSMRAWGSYICVLFNLMVHTSQSCYFPIERLMLDRPDHAALDVFRDAVRGSMEPSSFRVSQFTMDATRILHSE